jgi:hypothetical protein
VATIVVLEHLLQERLGIDYMAYELARRWEERGHRVAYHRGVGTPPPGDVALMHHDLTVIPDSYREVARAYPRVINGAALDISKSRYSGCRLRKSDAWDGQVIIKTDANHGGHVDDALRRMALEQGLASDIAPGPVMDDYYLCDSKARVPEALWDTPGVLVEKYIPERDARGSYLRIWTFFGDRELSSRYRSDAALIKADNVLERQEAPVPEAMRAERERLGFDFGKFDFVLHEGRYVLLDANRTPGAPARIFDNPRLATAFDDLSRGVESFIAGAR